METYSALDLEVRWFVEAMSREYVMLLLRVERVVLFKDVPQS